MQPFSGANDMTRIALARSNNHPSESGVYREIAVAITNTIARLHGEIDQDDTNKVRSVSSAIVHLTNAYKKTMASYWIKAKKELGDDASLPEIEERFIELYSSYVAGHSKATANQISFVKPHYFRSSEYVSAKAIVDRCATESVTWAKTLTQIVDLRSAPEPTSMRM